MEKDPVCGMLVEQSEAAAEREFAGRTWYFCSTDCLKKFDQTPQCFAGPPQRSPAENA